MTPPLLQRGTRAIQRRLRLARRTVYEQFGNASYTPKPSLGELDDKLAKYLNFNGGVFIEAGGNDGVTQSNTYYLEKGKKWTGILVEAIPELYLKCQAARKKSVTFHCALVAQNYPEKTVKMHFANLMSVADGAMPLDQMEEHLRFGLECQNLAGTYDVEVPAMTLASLVKQCKLTRIDFLSLDVEGGELSVLDGLDLRVNRPRFILVEARYFEEVNAHLISHEYVMVEQLSYHDFLYTDGRLK